MATTTDTRTPQEIANEFLSGGVKEERTPQEIADDFLSEPSGFQPRVQSSFEVFKGEALSAATLGHVDSGVSELSATLRPGARVGGQLVGGLAPILTATKLIQSPIAAFATIGALRKANTPEERLENILGEAAFGALFQVVAPLSRAAKAAILGSSGGVVTLLEGGSLEDAAISAGIMGGLGAIHGKRRMPKTEVDKIPTEVKSALREAETNNINIKEIVDAAEIKIEENRVATRKAEHLEALEEVRRQPGDKAAAEKLQLAKEKQLADTELKKMKAEEEIQETRDALKERVKDTRRKDLKIRPQLERNVAGNRKLKSKENEVKARQAEYEEALEAVRKQPKDRAESEKLRLLKEKKLAKAEAKKIEAEEELQEIREAFEQRATDEAVEKAEVGSTPIEEIDPRLLRIREELRTKAAVERAEGAPKDKPVDPRLEKLKQERTLDQQKAVESAQRSEEVKGEISPELKEALGTPAERSVRILAQDKFARSGDTPKTRKAIREEATKGTKLSQEDIVKIIGEEVEVLRQKGGVLFEHLIDVKARHKMLVKEGKGYHNQLPQDIKIGLGKNKINANNFAGALADFVTGNVKRFSEAVKNWLARASEWIKTNVKLKHRPGEILTPKGAKKALKEKKPTFTRGREFGKWQARNRVSETEIQQASQSLYGESLGRVAPKEKTARIQQEIIDKRAEIKAEAEESPPGAIGHRTDIHKRLQKLMFGEEGERSIFLGKSGDVGAYRVWLEDNFGVKRLRDLSPEQARVAEQRLATRRRGLINEQNKFQENEKAVGVVNHAVDYGKQVTGEVTDFFRATIERLRRTPAGTELAEQKIAQTVDRYSLTNQNVSFKVLEESLKKYGLTGTLGQLRSWLGSNAKTLRWYEENARAFRQSEGKMEIPEGLNRALIQDFDTAFAKVFELMAKGAEDLSVEGFKRVENIGYFPQWFTTSLREILLKPESPLALEVKRQTKIFGKDKNKIWSSFVKASERKFGSLEFERKILIPDKVEFEGKTYKLVETDPFKLSPRYIVDGWNRLGVVKAFGQGKEATQKINATIEQIRKEADSIGLNGNSEAQYAFNVLEELRGYGSRPPNTILMKGLADVSNVVTANQMALAAIPNMIAGNVPMAARTSFRTLLEAYAEVFSDGSTFRLLKSVGAFAQPAMNSMYDVAGFGAGLKQGVVGKGATTFLRAMRFEAANNFVNQVNSVMAIRWFAKAAARGDRKAFRQLRKDFYFSEVEVEAILARGKLTETDMVNIANRTPALSNVTRESVLDRQPWMNKTLAKHTLRYTGFVRNLGRSLQFSIDEARINNNYKPIVRHMLAVGLGTEAVIFVRNWIKGRERQDEGVWQRIYLDLLYGGAFGLGGEVLQTGFFSAKFDENPMLRLVGPTFETAGEFYLELAKLVQDDKEPDWLKMARRQNPALDAFLQQVGQERNKRTVTR